MAGSTSSRLHGVQPEVDDVNAADAGSGALPWRVAGAGVTTGALVAVAGAALHAGVLLAWAQAYEWMLHA